MSQAVLHESTRLQLLHQLFAAATHEASAAMCRWTDGLVTLALDEVRETPLDEVCQLLDVGDDLLAMVVLSIPAEIGGELVLAFDSASGRRLAGYLLHREPTEGLDWDALDKAALEETGNILGCAYLNAIARLIDAELVPSPPLFLHDYAASVLQQALMTQIVDSDKLVLCRTVFRREGELLDWQVFFVPTPAMQRRIEQALHVPA
jgi:chemotaxis protein CheC